MQRIPTQRILITGMSGTGKSSVIEALAARGFAAIDTDSDKWCEWHTDESAQPDWIWRTDRIEALLSAPHETALFVSGCKSNQGQFYSYFNQIVLLSASLEVMLSRIAARSNNSYGKTAAEREQIVQHLEWVEPLLRARATLELDTSRFSVAEIADQLAALGTG
ncbi:AAA family ATPase [Deinococcus puniceus]|uniref:Shikimate kinase n=1 Tax=Deinococcus puniceus TaxID=1182568 RepID=A0A172TBJ8_9DEIO|nr:AAA family ATPase [Deinococcus puniceus]ANE44173.1 shikimate kinase [Deinococcus puniceus]